MPLYNPYLAAPPGGLGAYGVFAPSQAMPYRPGMPPQVPGFQQGNQYEMPYSYGPGSALGGYGVGAIAGAGTLGLGALSMAGMFSSNPAFMPFNPFGAGAAGWGAAGRMGLGMGGKIAGAALGGGLSLGMLGLGAHAFGSLARGSQEQANLDRVMGQFNFQNPMARSGKGFSRQDSMAIGNMVREMANLPEMLTSVSELSRVMDRMGSMGLLQKARDVASFKQKFSQTVSTLKDVARIMGSSLEDALSVLGEARTSGFYSRTDILRNALNRQTVGTMTGMNQSQVYQVQRMGSEMGFAAGGTRKTGSVHALRTANQIGIAHRMGLLKDREIAELTGLEGPEGQQALAGMMTEASYRMMLHSNVGQALALGLGKTEGGRFTGQIDENLVDRMRMGVLGVGEIMGLGRGKARGRRGMLSFVANRRKLTAEAAGTLGLEGVNAMMQSILGKLGMQNEDAQTVLMNRYGLDERMAEMVTRFAKNLPEITSQAVAGARYEAETATQQAFYKEHASFDAIKRKVQTRLRGIFTTTMEQAGANLRNWVAGGLEGIVDRMYGIHRGELTPAMSQKFGLAAAGVSGAQEYLSDLRTRAMGLDTRTIEEGPWGHRKTIYSRGLGSLGSLISGLTGDQTYHGGLARVAQALGARTRGRGNYGEPGATEELGGVEFFSESLDQLGDLAKPPQATRKGYPEGLLGPRSMGLSWAHDLLLNATGSIREDMQQAFHGGTRYSHQELKDIIRRRQPFASEEELSRLARGEASVLGGDSGVGRVVRAIQGIRSGTPGSFRELQIAAIENRKAAAEAVAGHKALGSEEVVGLIRSGKFAPLLFGSKDISGLMGAGPGQRRLRRELRDFVLDNVSAPTGGPLEGLLKASGYSGSLSDEDRGLLRRSLDYAAKGPGARQAAVDLEAASHLEGFAIGQESFARAGREIVTSLSPEDPALQKQLQGLIRKAGGPLARAVRDVGDFGQRWAGADQDEDWFEGKHGMLEGDEFGSSELNRLYLMGTRKGGLSKKQQKIAREIMGTMGASSNLVRSKIYLNQQVDQLLKGPRTYQTLGLGQWRGGEVGKAAFLGEMGKLFGEKGLLPGKEGAYRDIMADPQFAKQVAAARGVAITEQQVADTLLQLAKTVGTLAGEATPKSPGATKAKKNQSVPKEEKLYSGGD